MSRSICHQLTVQLGIGARIVSCESVIKKGRYIYDLICATVLPPHCFVGYFHHLSRLGNIHARQENKLRVRKGRRAFGLWSGPPGFVRGLDLSALFTVMVAETAALVLTLCLPLPSSIQVLSFLAFGCSSCMVRCIHSQMSACTHLHVLAADLMQDVVAAGLNLAENY